MGSSVKKGGQGVAELANMMDIIKSSFNRIPASIEQYGYVPVAEVHLWPGLACLKNIDGFRFPQVKFSYSYRN
jgi:hypothetical protein